MFKNEYKNKGAKIKSPQTRLVRCCRCGIEGESKDMGNIGNNVYKCVFCLCVGPPPREGL